MYSNRQLNLLKDFALKSDFLFEKGVITTDSFTGEIGEFIACQHFKLSKSDRCTKSVDGIDQFGRKYQVKSKVTNNNRYSFNAKGLEIADFDFLVIVFFDINYKPLKMIKIASDNIENNHFKLNRTNLSQFETINESEIKIEGDVKKINFRFCEFI